MWDPPRPGLEPVSPALAGRFSTTAPPGKPPSEALIKGIAQNSTSRSYTRLLSGLPYMFHKADLKGYHFTKDGRKEDLS